MTRVRRGFDAPAHMKHAAFRLPSFREACAPTAVGEALRVPHRVGYLDGHGIT